MASLAIDAGGGSSGNWVADTDYSSGWVSGSNAPVNTSGVTSPAPQSVYQTQRVGVTFGYAISGLAANQAYTVRLHFADTYFASSGQRLFNVTINGSQVLTNFDIVAASGGQNVAIIKTFKVTTSSQGSISIQFAASVNNATLAGIEVLESGAAPQPTATPSPGGGGSGQYPTYSSYFTGNTPFHHTVAQLLGVGAQTLSSTIAQNYWAQGLGNSQPAIQTGGVGPLYVAASGQPAYVFNCPAYGTCNASGLVVHYPSSAHAQTGSDHHLNSFDPIYLHGEVDGWGGDGNSGQACNLNSGNPGSATCSWGGFYPFSGTGLASNGNSGDAGGYALGLMDVSAQELLSGHIDHALGLAQSCLDDGGVYPATLGRNSDSHCPSYLEPNAKYGHLIHVKSSVDIGSRGYSQYCRVIVSALQTYGGYTADTNGSWGIAISLESPSVYSGSNPWFDTIFPSMVAGGDGVGSGSNFSFNSCLNRLSSNDIEVLQISTNLP